MSNSIPPLPKWVKEKITNCELVFYPHIHQRFHHQYEHRMLKERLPRYEYTLTLGPLTHDEKYRLRGFLRGPIANAFYWRAGGEPPMGWQYWRAIEGDSFTLTASGWVIRLKLHSIHPLN
jgi:hypothetical protein